MNDHTCKRITRKTIHALQKQIIIIFHSKLEPVEAVRSLCYTDIFTIHPASFPKNCQPPLTSSRVLFVSKRSYLKLKIDPISLDRPPIKVGHQIPYKMILHYMCPTDVTHQITNSK